MPNPNAIAVSLLNDLIEVCKDGEKGFREAAEGIRNAYYQALFNDYSRLRGQFAKQLQAQVRTLGGNPDRKGSMAGALHRGWMNLRAAIDRHNDNLIIEECERGEELATKAYEDALKKDLPDLIQTILQQHLEQIIETRKRIQAMKE